MSAYKIDIEKKVKMEYPEAWELLEKFRGFVKESGSEPINIMIITPDMTEEEEMMAHIECELKEGYSLEEAEKRVKYVYEMMRDAEKQNDFKRKQKENKKNILNN